MSLGDSLIDSVLWHRNAAYVIDQTALVNGGTSTNSGDAYTITTTVPVIRVYSGEPFLIKFNSTNTTTSPTLTVTGAVTAKALLRFDGTALQVGELIANAYYMVVYNSATDSFLVVTTPLGNIEAIALLSGTGILCRTGTNTWALRTLTAPAAGITVSNGGGVAGNPTLALANDLSAVEGLSSTGLATRTATDTWTTRSLAAPSAGFTISNNDGVSGNPTFALADDLSALEALSSTGLAARTGTSTWAVRTLTGPAAGITVSNGDGVSGNPTLALANDLSALEALSSTGIAARTGTDTWAQRTITGTSNQITVTNGDGVSGNPTLSTPQNIDTGASVTFNDMVLSGLRLVFQALAGGVVYKDNAVNAAGTNQGTAAQVYNFTFVDGADGTKGVILPSSIAGWVVFIYNYTTSNLKIYPASGEAIGQHGTNNAATVAGQTLNIFMGHGGAWYGGSIAAP